MKTRDMALKIAGYASMAVFAFAAVSCGTKKSVVPEHTAETVRPAEVAKKPRLTYSTASMPNAVSI